MVMVVVLVDVVVVIVMLVVVGIFVEKEACVILGIGVIYISLKIKLWFSLLPLYIIYQLVVMVVVEMVVVGKWNLNILLEVYILLVYDISSLSSGGGTSV